MKTTSAIEVRYGSRRTGADEDILQVGDHTTPSQHQVVGSRDVLIIGWPTFWNLIALADPLVTEPVLTGDLVQGDPAVWRRIWQECVCKVPDERCAAHCQQQARRLIESLAQLAPAAATPRELLDTLGFAISYASFARAYAPGTRRALTFAALRARGLLLFPKFWERYSVAKASPALALLLYEQARPMWIKAQPSAPVPVG